MWEFKQIENCCTSQFVYRIYARGAKRSL